MKKKYIVFFLVIILLLVTGCGKNEKVLKCTQFSKGTNMNMESEVEFHFIKDKLKYTKMEGTFIDIQLDNLPSVWDSIKNQLNEQNEPVEEKGYKRKTKADDKNYTFTVSIEIKYDLLTKEVAEKYGVADYKDKTYEEIKKIMESDENITCK